MIFIFMVSMRVTPNLMAKLNEAKDAVKDEIKATKDEIEYSAGYV